MFRNLFPESIFPRRLSPAAESRQRLAHARAEEAIIRAHVDNALMFVDTLAEDLSFDRAIDTYVRVMGIPEPLASVVATRTLVVLGQDLVPFRRRYRDGEEGADDGSGRPRLRLNDGADARQGRAIKRA
jgi:hypothetical protein